MHDAWSDVLAHDWVLAALRVEGVARTRAVLVSEANLGWAGKRPRTELVCSHGLTTVVSAVSMGVAWVEMKSSQAKSGGLA